MYFFISVCVCEFTCKCVCASAWGHVCEVFVCVCIHGHRSTVNLGDTISGYHVIAYDKLRVLYDNNDTRVPFPKMSKLIQVCIWRVSLKLQLLVTEWPPQNQPLSLTKGKTLALPNINIFLSPEAKLLYTKIKLLYRMQTSSYSLSSLSHFYMLLRYRKRASTAHNPLKWETVYFLSYDKKALSWQERRACGSFCSSHHDEGHSLAGRETRCPVTGELSWWVSDALRVQGLRVRLGGCDASLPPSTSDLRTGSRSCPCVWCKELKNEILEFVVHAVPRATVTKYHSTVA